MAPLPPFYKHCISAIRHREQLLQQKTNHIYTLPVQEAPALQLRIKRGRQYYITNYSHTFRNLHNPRITPKAREVTCLLLFSMTPTTERAAHRSKQTAICNICRKKIQETGNHIFYTCVTVTDTSHPETIDRYAHQQKYRHLQCYLCRHHIKHYYRNTHKTVANTRGVQEYSVSM